MEAQWLVACDGANSPIRAMVGAFLNKFFQDRFLIADIVMKADFPPRRWFWFDPLPPQPVGAASSAGRRRVAAISSSAGTPIPRKPRSRRTSSRACARRGRRARIRTGMGFGLSVCLPAHRRLPPRPRYLRRRCGASGVALRRKRRQHRDPGFRQPRLEAETGSRRPPRKRLIDTYTEERAYAADDNLMNSTRSTDFITPKERRQPGVSRRGAGPGRTSRLRAAAGHQRQAVDADAHLRSSLNTPDAEVFAARMSPGTNCADAPILTGDRPGWLLEHLGDGFCVLTFGDAPPGAVQARPIAARGPCGSGRMWSTARAC